MMKQANIKLIKIGRDRWTVRISTENSFLYLTPPTNHEQAYSDYINLKSETENYD